MSNIDKQALRQKSESASAGEWVKESGAGWHAVCSSDDQANSGFIVAHFEGPDSNANREFVQAANPATVLALLDELEAADALNKHLELAIRKAEGCSEALRRKTEAAEKRVAELEARTLVPVEPTLDQLVAGKRRLTSTGRMSRLMSQRLAEVYRAMVNAAAAGKGDAS